MARKRISEEDILDFRKRADELSQEVRVKYDRMDSEAKPAPEPEPTGERGILLIHDAGESPEQLNAFAAILRREGYVAECVDLTGYVPVDRFDKKPLWQRWLEVTQGAYQRLSERCQRVMILGTGLSCPLACVISEQFSVDALMLVGGGLKTAGFTFFSGGVKSASFQLARLAKNNLFSIVCPILCIVPEGCAPYTVDSANMYALATRSDDVRIEKNPGDDPLKIWTNCEKQLLEAVKGFFKGD
jgi:hypothetical protein